MEDKEFQNLQRRLRETRQLAEDNNELLRKVYGILWRGRVFRILYWVIIIGVAIGAFYFLEPYLDQANTLYGSFQEQLNAVPGFGGGS